MDSTEVDYISEGTKEEKKDFLLTILDVSILHIEGKVKN